MVGRERACLAGSEREKAFLSIRFQTLFCFLFSRERMKAEFGHFQAGLMCSTHGWQ